MKSNSIHFRMCWTRFFFKSIFSKYLNEIHNWLSLSFSAVLLFEHTWFRRAKSWIAFIGESCCIFKIITIIVGCVDYVHRTMKRGTRSVSPFIYFTWFLFFDISRRTDEPYETMKRMTEKQHLWSEEKKCVTIVNDKMINDDEERKTNEKTK